MHSDVERHIERVDEVPQVEVHSEQVMDMQAADAGRAQNGGDAVDLLGRQHRDGMARQRRDRQRDAARSRFQKQEIGAIARTADQIADVASHAAAKRVGDQQGDRATEMAEQRGGGSEAGRTGRILADVLVDQPCIVRPAFGKQGLALRGLTVAIGAEADLAGVENEGVAGQQVVPAAGGGAQAEIVFFAVPAAEGGGVEQADIPSAARRRYMQKPTVVGTWTWRAALATRQASSSVATGRSKAGAPPAMLG